MQLEVGTVLTGKVTGITKYGVFVDIGSGKSGMVHISEVASTYVKEIRDYVTDGQEVKVKVLAVSEDGKVSLSIKQASENYSAQRPQPRQRQNNGYSSAASRTSEPASFDDMLSRFMQSSDEKISTLRKNNAERRPSRRGSGK